MNDFTLTFFASIAAAILTSLATWIIAARRLPASHRIAILGFPQSGKTTLITALFEFFFRYGARGKSIVPRGEETIRRINDNIKQLELRRPIKPTTDQDVFAYRADILLPPGPFQRRYKLEIGDFPGEDTLAFTEQYGDWLHSTPYFQWAVSADAFVFVVDVRTVIGANYKEDIARQKSAFRAAWQRLREHHLDGTADLSSKLLLLVFTKADLIASPPDAWGSDDATEIPEKHVVDLEHLKKAKDIVGYLFADLTEYFEREARRFGVVFTSIFSTVDGERLGIPELAARVLPRPSLLPMLRPPTSS
jgi:GTPase SAR1 family protein